MRLRCCEVWPKQRVEVQQVRVRKQGNRHGGGQWGEVMYVGTARVGSLTEGQNHARERKGEAAQGCRAQITTGFDCAVIVWSL